MEGPGMSLFQGAASIHINNSVQDRLEEQEELEDKKRLNEEVYNNVAFFRFMTCFLTKFVVVVKAQFTKCF